MTLREKFVEYCKGKIKDDLGVVVLEKEHDNDEEEEEERVYEVLMLSDGIREFENVKILNNEEIDGLLAVDENDNIVIDSPMLDVIHYALRMEFSFILKDIYNDILENVEDLDEEFEKSIDSYLK